MSKTDETYQTRSFSIGHVLHDGQQMQINYQSKSKGKRKIYEDGTDNDTSYHTPLNSITYRK